MGEGLIKYDERPHGKLLPSKLLIPFTRTTYLDLGRGTVFPSRPEALAFNWVVWAFSNLALFLLPLFSGLGAMFFSGASTPPEDPHFDTAFIGRSGSQRRARQCAPQTERLFY
jgi:hypothetical protein